MFNSYELQPIRFGGFYAACYPPDAWRSCKNAHEWINEAEFDGNDFLQIYIQQQDLQTGHGATCKELSQGA